MLTFIQCLFHPCVIAVACKRPWSFCQKCRWQVTPKYAYTLDPSKSEWADYATAQTECGNLSGNELTRNSSGNTWSQSLGLKREKKLIRLSLVSSVFLVALLQKDKVSDVTGASAGSDTLEFSILLMSLCLVSLYLAL